MCLRCEGARLIVVRNDSIMANILSYFIAIMETYISLRGRAGQVLKDGAILRNEKSADIIVRPREKGLEPEPTIIRTNKERF